MDRLVALLHEAGWRTFDGRVLNPGSLACHYVLDGRAEAVLLAKLVLVCWSSPE